MRESKPELSDRLKRWSQGDSEARDEVVEQLYQELKRVARAQLSSERAGHTLQPTALVNEAWMKLAGAHGIQVNDRPHFIALAARMMRQILIDSGRRKQAGKRSDEPTPSLLYGTPSGQTGTLDLMALDAALERLETAHPEQARVVELRYFGGLSIEETAAAMSISASTAKRYWRAARAWLYLELGAPSDG
ncbi:ECF-type sigma factor [Wenzhouxiangella marina]|uniref:ECF subfamily RNA polymerase sigma-24 factor n=1 Tax=Wenzhouxiangella marina TaxID=1579979 RepID=A0A0K0XZ57_9GAMM|nr:ECF-type sigma factor [Wenzhouxiangella marina]AKS42973.1 ECF subfamily RNA polymerase sigma-24 factor [Wenzhouxiangella marina]MBB6087343.1 RNA polymerase sigma factor (TIGR02999 family) [Wenzhouxiangella marina]